MRKEKKHGYKKKIKKKKVPQPSCDQDDVDNVNFAGEMLEMGADAIPQKEKNVAAYFAHIILKSIALLLKRKAKDG